MNLILIIATAGAITGCFLAFINFINSVERYIGDDNDGS